MSPMGSVPISGSPVSGTPIRMAPSPVIGIIPSPVRIVPTPVVAIPPAIPGVSPIVSPSPGVSPSDIQSDIQIDGGGSPSSEHGGDIFGFDPDFVAHDHYVIESGVIGGEVLIFSASDNVCIAVRHFVASGAHSFESVFVGFLVGIGKDIFVRVIRFVMDLIGGLCGSFLSL